MTESWERRDNKNIGLSDKLNSFKYDVQFDLIKASIRVRVTEEEDKTRMRIDYERNMKASWVQGNGSAQSLERFFVKERELLEELHKTDVKFKREREDHIFSEFTIRYTFDK